MLELKISATIRDKFGKQVKFLKREGVIPAVLYGHGTEATSISLNLREFARVYKQAGESTIVGLNVEKDGKIQEYPVLIHDVDSDPVTDVLRHADFYVVRMDEKITASIPLIFVGESEAVKAHGGIFLKNIHEVQVEALPKDLPHEIEVDISFIKEFSDHISLKDLKLPSGAIVQGDPNEVVALVKPPRTEEELKALDGAVEINVDAVKVDAEEKKKEAAEKAAAEEEAK